MTSRSTSQSTSRPKSEFDIGPGALATAGEQGGPPFLLSKAEWLSIQTYVTDALALPITDAELKTSLGPGAGSNLTDFTQLVAAYKSINGHVTTWQNTTFPATVSLASDIYEYGFNKAPAYFPPILVEAQKLEANPDDTNAKKALKAILDSLSKDAETYHKRATTVAALIKEFADNTSKDQTTLTGTDGKGGLVKYYQDKYGATSKEVAEIGKEIKAQKLVLSAANAEYDHDVVVAATTPTYAWVFPVGTIAAAVVAGVYGDKAVKALARARAAQAKIDSLSSTLQADTQLILGITSAQVGMNGIVSALVQALPTIQKIQGIWGALRDDIGAIVTMIDQDIRKVPPIIMDLGVEEATKAWYAVAQAANNYRVNAYIKVQSSAPSIPLARSA